MDHRNAIRLHTEVHIDVTQRKRKKLKSEVMFAPPWRCFGTTLHYEIIVVINGVPRNFVFGNVKFMHLTNPHLLLIIF